MFVVELFEYSLALRDDSSLCLCSCSVSDYNNNRVLVSLLDSYHAFVLNLDGCVLREKKASCVPRSSHQLLSSYLCVLLLYWFSSTMVSLRQHHASTGRGGRTLQELVILVASAPLPCVDPSGLPLTHLEMCTSTSITTTEFYFSWAPAQLPLECTVREDRSRPTHPTMAAE
jgi:hypothetical protein